MLFITLLVHHLDQATELGVCPQWSQPTPYTLTEPTCARLSWSTLCAPDHTSTQPFSDFAQSFCYIIKYFAIVNLAILLDVLEIFSQLFCYSKLSHLECCWRLQQHCDGQWKPNAASQCTSTSVLAVLSCWEPFLLFVAAYSRKKSKLLHPALL
jgi:hypothetical protein